MNDILFKKIKRANSKYAEYLSACDKVAKAAQKHINWNDSVGCAYMPGDGLCIEIEAHVCPATRFFELPDIIGNDMIDEYTYRPIAFNLKQVNHELQRSFKSIPAVRNRRFHVPVLY